jgi:hypothetical protein
VKYFPTLGFHSVVSHKGEAMRGNQRIFKIW